MRKYALYIFLFLAPAAARSQQLMTLQEALKTGLQNNFGVMIYQRQADIAHKDNTLGNAGFLPTVEADGAYQYSDQYTHQHFATGLEQQKANAITRSLVTGIEADWTVFNGFQMFYNRDKLAHLEKNAQLSFRDQVEQSAANIMSAYYAVVMANQQLKVYQEAIRFSQTRLDLAKTKYEVGTTFKLEYLQALVDLNSDSSNYVKQTAVINKAKYDLNNMISSTGINYTTKDTIILVPKLELGTLQSGIQSGNIRLNLANLNQQIAADNLHISQSNLFPTLGLMARYNLSNVNAEAGFVTLNQTRGMIYGVSARWNIFNGFNYTRLVQDAKMQQDIARLNTNAVSLDITTQLNKAYEDYSVALTSVSLENRNFDAARQNLDIALDRYKIGKTSVLEYRQAQVNYTDAHNRLLTAIYTAKVAEIQLYRLTGQMQNIKE
jgi:outer membrane protein TolC